ncbi:ABC transporter permease [symbiont of Argiope bruennichi]|uniref:ABC transporter permease n=1 Tax=symbiont of Argiope bruennichi TaxID=2810479 RepID=UPI003DA497CC
MLKNWLRNFQGPFFALVFPLISVWIMGSIVVSYTTSSSVPGQDNPLSHVFLSIIPSFIALIIISVCMSSFTNQLIDFKTSVIIKRIGVSPISKIHFFLASYCFAIFLSFISTLWIVSVIEIFFHSDIYSQAIVAQAHMLQNFSSFLIFALGWLLGIFVATSISFWVTSISNSQGKAIGIIMLFFFPTMFLSGAQLPPSLIDHSPSLKIVSYFIPQRYAIQVLYSGYFSSSFFGTPNETIKVIYQNSPIHAWHAAIIALSFSLLLSTWTFSTWKWEN